MALLETCSSYGQTGKQSIRAKAYRPRVGLVLSPERWEGLQLPAQCHLKGYLKAGDCFGVCLPLSGS